MTRTFADMTPAECVGMWCEDQDDDLVVLHCVHESRVDGQVVVVAFHPPSGDRLRYIASELTPRLDLPRAWTPSGEPVEMDLDYGQVEWGRITADFSADRTTLPEGTRVTRHVTDWEAAP